MLKVIIFNSAPRSGKGVAAKTVLENLGDVQGVHLEFKDELFKVAANALGTTVERFKFGYDITTAEMFGGEDYIPLQFKNPAFKWFKDVPTYTVGKIDYSQRSWLIHCSENVIKPSFGKSAFGDMLVNSLPEEGVVAISDGGFVEEVLPVIHHVGAENVTIVHIEREGCTFDGDSRDYLTPEMFDKGVRFVKITNNKDITSFQSKVKLMLSGVLSS